MDTETKTLVAVLRDRMERMSDDERITLLDSLFDGYCKHCGSYLLPCHCMNDE